MAISDLENVSCCDNAKYDDAEHSDFVAMLKGEATPEVFLHESSRKNTFLFTSEPVQLSFFE
jgi:hypothetical protein